MIDPNTIPDLPGTPVLDTDGDIIGSVARVDIHETTGAPLWVSIHTHVDGAPNLFAPLGEARFDDQPGSALHLPWSRTVVEDAPMIATVDTLTSHDVQALHGYYDTLTPTTAAGLPGSPADSVPTDVIDIVRSEEQLRISTVSVPKERIRVHKVIVTEERTITVTIRREELRITREPIDGTVYADTRTGSSDEHAHPDLEVVLFEERPVVGMELVPVERVRVAVTVVTEQLPVTDTVRKERVDIDTPTQ